MDIQTSNFGKQTINADEIISFPQAMIGLEDYTEFKLFHEESDAPSVHYLQSVSEPELLMSIVSPSELGIEYKVELSDEEETLLKLENTEDATIALAIYKPNENETTASEGELKAIFSSPIIINTVSRLALQKHMPHMEVMN